MTSCDGSAGRPLAHTASGAFLCLLAEAADAGFAPVPLLALLKHPLAAGRQAPAAFRAQVRRLDRLCLRGPRPDHGLASIESMIVRADADARDEHMKEAIAETKRWFKSVAKMLSPLAEAMAAKDIAIADAVTAHVTVAEALAVVRELYPATEPVEDALLPLGYERAPEPEQGGEQDRHPEQPARCEPRRRAGKGEVEDDEGRDDEEEHRRERVPRAELEPLALLLDSAQELIETLRQGLGLVPDSLPEPL